MGVGFGTTGAGSTATAGVVTEDFRLGGVGRVLVDSENSFSFSFSFSGASASRSLARDSAVSPSQACPGRSVAVGDHFHFAISSSIRRLSQSASEGPEGGTKSTLTFARDTVLEGGDDREVSKIHAPRPIHSSSCRLEHRLKSFFMSRSKGSAGSNTGILRMLAMGLPSPV